MISPPSPSGEAPRRWHPAKAETLQDGEGFTTRHVDELRPHPSFLQHRLAPATSKLSALSDRGDLAFQDPLTVTAEGIILDGFARWSLARLRSRSTLPCVIRQLDEADALVYILQQQRRSAGLNDFVRVSLALQLEPNFRAAARYRQQVGGEKKGLSKLTGAQRIDVRLQIAQTAGACVANVDKVRRLIESADAAVLTALQVGEIRIHRAWTWLECSKDGGLQEYKNYRNEADMRRTIKTLIARQVARRPAASEDLKKIRRALCELSSKPRYEGLITSIEVLLERFDFHVTDKPIQDVDA